MKLRLRNSRVDASYRGYGIGALACAKEPPVTLPRAYARANFDASSVAPTGLLILASAPAFAGAVCCHLPVSEACAWRPNFMGRFHLRLAPCTGIAARRPYPLSPLTWLTGPSAGSSVMESSSRHEQGRALKCEPRRAGMKAVCKALGRSWKLFMLAGRCLGPARQFRRRRRLYAPAGLAPLGRAQRQAWLASWQPLRHSVVWSSVDVMLGEPVVEISVWIEPAGSGSASLRVLAQMSAALAPPHAPVRVRMDLTLTIDMKVRVGRSEFGKETLIVSDCSLRGRLSTAMQFALLTIRWSQSWQFDCQADQTPVAHIEMQVEPLLLSPPEHAAPRQSHQAP